MTNKLNELAAQAGLHAEWFIDNPEIEEFAKLIVHRIYEQILLTMRANMDSEEVAWCCTHIIEKVSSDLGIEDNAQPWGNK
jgi:hypothetical protein